MTAPSSPAHYARAGGRNRYHTLHRRVRRLRGRPQHCEVCGTTDPAVRYEWANITGNYADPQDYARLCRLCHRFFDGERRRVTEGRPVYGGLLGRELLDHYAARIASGRAAS